MADTTLIKGQNPYDENFNWDPTDPWLGTNPEFGYIDIAEDTGNYGWYWLYPCQTNPSAPVLVTFIGGPGLPVLTKAFGRYNPQHIDDEEKCLKVNKNSLTQKMNLLYVENPIGSGQSIAKIPIKSHEHDIKSMETFFTLLQDKYPQFKQADFYWNGESYSGQSIPTNVLNLHKNQNMNTKGIILENPLIDKKLQIDPKFYIKLLDDNTIWHNCCHEQLCEGLIKSIGCLFKSGCVSFQTLQNASFMPFFVMIHKVKGKDCFDVPPTNLFQKDVPVDSLLCDAKVTNLINSEKFLELINSKKGKMSSDNELITYNEPNFSSIESINEILDTGIRLMIVSGEGDYIYPLQGQSMCIDQFQWNQKEMFDELGWERGDTCISKSVSSFKWLKKYGVGHNIFHDDPEFHEEMVLQFCEECMTQSGTN